jgi:hypothetical protein
MMVVGVKVAAGAGDGCWRWLRTTESSTGRGGTTEEIKGDIWV